MTTTVGPLAGVVVESEVSTTGQPLNAAQAQQLTSAIRAAVDLAAVLIVKAHEGRAWEAMGYRSWEQYVTMEFAVSRSRSYQLLNQAKVIGALQNALPPGTAVTITEAAARDLKPVLGDLTDDLAAAAEGLPPEQAQQVLAEKVSQYREQAAANRAGDGTGGSGSDGYGHDHSDAPAGHQHPHDADDIEHDDDVWAPETAPDTGGFTSFDDTYDDFGDFTPDPETPGTSTALRARSQQSAVTDLFFCLNLLNQLNPTHDGMDTLVGTIPTERLEAFQAMLPVAVSNMQLLCSAWERAGHDPIVPYEERIPDNDNDGTDDAA